MNRNIKNIIIEKIKKYNLKKTELEMKIKKSILQNNNIKNNIKIYAKHMILKRTKNNTFLSKQHKICLLTGKRGGVFKGFNLSRYQIKNLIICNRFTNLKKNNW